MNEIPLHLAALGGIGIIEIVIGATALLTFIAIICFFIGDKRERVAAAVGSPVAGQAFEPETEPELEEEFAPVEPPFKADAMDTTEATEEKPGPELAPDELPKPDEPTAEKRESVLPDFPQLDSKEEEPDEEEEMERKFIENKLKRIADKRAEKKQDEPEDVKVYPKGPAPDRLAKSSPDTPSAEEKTPEPVEDDPPIPPLPKLAEPAPTEAGEEKAEEPVNAPVGDEEQSMLPDIPKPGGELPSLSDGDDEDDEPEPPPLPQTASESESDLPPFPETAKDESPALPELPDLPEDDEVVPPPLPKKAKPGSDLPPLPETASIEDEADLQTREQEREA